MNDEEIKLEFDKIKRRLDLLEGNTKHSIKKAAKQKTEGWYRKGSTIHKIIILDEENFFRIPKTISEIVHEFKSKDYHLKASDLTLPLRKIVRRGILKKTKRDANGTESKKWMYIRG